MSDIDFFRTLREVEESDDESPLREELKPWPRGTWDQLGTRTTRVGLIGRKIGVIPMWYKNGRPCDVTMLHVRMFNNLSIGLLLIIKACM